MANALHTKAAGIRVHYVANLGGLAILAGLDHYPPDLLLGVLEEIAERLPKLNASRLAELKARGQGTLERRAAEKRAWKAWTQARDLHRLDLTTTELDELVALLGGKAPADKRLLPRVVAELLDKRFKRATRA